MISNCKLCGSEYKKKNGDQKFCSHKCAACYNNKNRVTKRDRHINLCATCKQPTKNDHFCSRECAAKYKSQWFYQRFLKGDMKDRADSYTPKIFKKYMLVDQDGKCAICGVKDEWFGKTLIFVMDHIDGNSLNNSRDNLRLVCPNCDSQLDTFKSKNKGSGRHYRIQRRNEGKSF